MFKRLFAETIRTASIAIFKIKKPLAVFVICGITIETTSLEFKPPVIPNIKFIKDSILEFKPVSLNIKFIKDFYLDTRFDYSVRLSSSKCPEFYILYNNKGLFLKRYDDANFCIDNKKFEGIESRSILDNENEWTISKVYKGTFGHEKFNDVKITVNPYNSNFKNVIFSGIHDSNDFKNYIKSYHDDSNPKRINSLEEYIKSTCRLY